MAAPVAPSVLLQVPIFRNLNTSECRQLADIATVEHVAPGQFVLRQGETSPALWIVLEGRCEVVTPREGGSDHAPPIVLATLEPFSHFGEMSFFHPAPHSASVVARTELKLLLIRRGDYDDLIRDGALGAYKLAYNVLDSLAQRLRRMDTWVADLLQRSPSQRSVSEWNTLRSKLFTEWNI